MAGPIIMERKAGNVEGCNFGGGNLEGGSFEGRCLKGGNLEGGSFEGRGLEGGNLDRGSFEGGGQAESEDADSGVSPRLSRLECWEIRPRKCSAGVL
jgi:hypothetical protein